MYRFCNGQAASCERWGPPNRLHQKVYEYICSHSATEVVDVSMGGATTGSLVSGQLPQLSTALGTTVSGETIAVITIGGNDMQTAIPLVVFGGDAAAENAISSVTSNLHTMIDYFQDSDRFPDGAYLYLANIYEPTDGTGYVSDCFWGQDLSATGTTLTPPMTPFVASPRSVAWRWWTFPLISSAMATTQRIHPVPTITKKIPPLGSWPTVSTPTIKAITN